MAGIRKRKQLMPPFDFFKLKCKQYAKRPWRVLKQTHMGTQRLYRDQSAEVGRQLHRQRLWESNRANRNYAFERGKRNPKILSAQGVELQPKTWLTILCIVSVQSFAFKNLVQRIVSLIDSVIATDASYYGVDSCRRRPQDNAELGHGLQS